LATFLKRLAALEIALVLGAGSYAAADTEQVPLGARAVAMGGAFSAIADDASAIFWNPAGLSKIGEEQLAFTHADLYGSGIRDDQVAFVLPLSPAHTQVLAGGWYHSGFSDAELALDENRFDLSYALRPHRWGSIGSTVKLLTRSADLDGSQLGDGRGVGMDFGLQLGPWDAVTLGLALQDAFDTHLDYSGGTLGGGSSVAYERHLRTGVAYTQRFGTLALDVDDRIHLGAELLPYRELALRAGLREDPNAHDLTYAFGAGFRAGTLRLDYAYEVHPVLGTTHHVSLNFGFQLNPPRIRIRAIHPEEMYASLYRSYDRQPIGTVEIENRHDKPLAMRLGVVIPELMRSAVEYDTTLRPQAVTVLPLRAVLSHSVLESPGDRPIHLQVEGTYENGRTTRRDRLITETMIYASGAINWSKGTEQAAAFVTTHDPVISDLAARAVRAAEDHPERFDAENLRAAAALVDALAIQGIAYVPDPENPFSAISEKPHAVDTVRYPRETLRRLSGDCDDTSVLIAALLESVGIRTQLVDAPGHIFVMFDSGIHPRDRLALPYPDRLLVTGDDRIWIPLESTLLGQGFAAAWRAGSEGCALWKGAIQTTDVAVAQDRYPESEVPGPSIPTIPVDATALDARLQNDSDTLRSWSREYRAVSANIVGATDVSVAALVELARAYLEAGDHEAARAALQRALEKEPLSPAVRNDLAVVSAAGGDYREARRLLEDLVSREPAHAGPWLNLGFASAQGGDEKGARRAYTQALQRGGGLEGVCGLLGIAPSTAAGPDAVRRLESAIAQAVAGSGVSATLYWRK
jgi:tetratricopeptide (TPR) repeat protein